MSELIRILWLMSVQASFLILVILLVRIVLCNYKKMYSYFLWFLVLVRLLCPIFIESRWSLQPDVPVSLETEDTSLMPEVITDNQEKNNDIVIPIQPGTLPAINVDEAPEVVTSERPSPVFYLQCIYLAGVIGFGIYFLVQYFGMRKRVSFAIRDKENIWLCDEIESPFVMGVIKPKIYLPIHISGKEKAHILRHECAHIAHKDPLVRMLGSIALILHWWNPLVWYAIHKMNQDMEMFCDETALAGASMAERKAYSNSLLQFSMKQSGIAVTLSFGESNTELRIKNVLRKKRTGILISIFVVVVGVLCGVAFLTVPKEETKKDNLMNTEESETQETEHTETENSEMIQNEFTEADIYGDWLVYHATDLNGISALSMEEQMSFSNIRLNYAEDACRYYDALGHYEERVNVLEYTNEYITSEDLEEAFPRIIFSELTGGADGMQYVHVAFEDDNRFGGHIYVCDEEEIIIYYEGVFFFAQKMDESDIAAHEGQFFYENVTNISKTEVESFASEVREQILNGDWAGISEKISYPITIAGTTCQNAEAFLALDMNNIVPEEFLRNMEEEDCEYMFCNWQGIMMGETGQIWFAEVLNDLFVSEGLKIIAINIPEKSTVTYETEPWYEAYQTILNDWTIIDDYADFSYLKRYFEGQYSFDNYWLCDVNSNGVPEFFLRSEYMSITAVFTYYDGQIRFLMYDAIDGINKETGEVIVYGHWHGAGGSGVNEWSAYQVTNNEAIKSLYIDFFDSENFDIEGLEKPYTIYTLENPTYEEQETSEEYDKLYAIHIQPAITCKAFERYSLDEISGLNYIQ